MGGIPPPSRGIVGENRSTRSKTTVRSKKVGLLESNGPPLLGSHDVIFLFVFMISLIISPSVIMFLLMFIGNFGVSWLFSISKIQF